MDYFFAISVPKIGSCLQNPDIFDEIDGQSLPPEQFGIGVRVVEGIPMLRGLDE